MAKWLQVVYILGLPQLSRTDPAVRMGTPIMGWMSWVHFRCETNCTEYPRDCINEDLYKSSADALVEKGLAAAGYIQVSIDDCWSKGRDANGKLSPDPDRFPSGMKDLSKYLHTKGLKFGTYGDAGTKTCGGYEGSLGHADVDVQTFQEWGVDYLKLDGCYLKDDEIPQAYRDFGNALRNTSILFSCSWPAYIGDNESKKPFDAMYHEAGCNTWRNWDDIDDTWSSLRSIIEYWAIWTHTLTAVPKFAWNDADMLIAGDDEHRPDQLTRTQAEIQLAVWCIIGSPLFLGADVRSISDDYVKMLTDRRMIAVSQDPLAIKGGCVRGCGGQPISAALASKKLQHENAANRSARSVEGRLHNLTMPDAVTVWHRRLFGGSAVAFVNTANVTSDGGEVVVSMPFPPKLCVRIWDEDSHNLCAAGEEGAQLDKHNVLIERIASNHTVPVQVRIIVGMLKPTSTIFLGLYYADEQANSPVVIYA